MFFRMSGPFRFFTLNCMVEFVLEKSWISALLISCWSGKEGSLGMLPFWPAGSVCMTEADPNMLLPMPPRVSKVDSPVFYVSALKF